jgi:hypothetical protein
MLRKTSKEIKLIILVLLSLLQTVLESCNYSERTVTRLKNYSDWVISATAHIPILHKAFLSSINISPIRKHSINHHTQPSDIFLTQDNDVPKLTVQKDMT